MALIKLSYLQQAVELASGSDGTGKKKLIDGAKPVAFRNLPVVEVKAGKHPASSIQHPEAGAQQQTTVHEAKLIIETNDGASGKKHMTSDGTAGATAINQPITPKQPLTGNQQAATTIAKTEKSKLGSLDGYRQQFVGKPQESAGQAIPLSQEKLQEHWQLFTQQLKDNKNPANQSFAMATLVIHNHQTFEVVTNNNLEQKFIEGERRVLSEYLQQVFNNRQLLFTIVVSDHVIIPQETGERPLTSRDQYFQIIEQYPLVQELRDRLKLELDY
jgi:DNA polymerase-3 subunit gamma/tau